VLLVVCVVQLSVRAGESKLYNTGIAIQFYLAIIRIRWTFSITARVQVSTYKCSSWYSLVRCCARKA
jgi:hypothetical protein